MNLPLINGIQHSWANIEVEILGRVVTGITEIMYDSKKVIEDVYGAGDEPIQRGEGNRTYTASITLKQFEVDAIQALVGSFKIDRIPPFNITVNYRSTLDQPSKTDILRNVQFKNNVRDWKQGQTSGDVKLELAIAGIV